MSQTVNLILTAEDRERLLAVASDRKSPAQTCAAGADHSPFG
jgi:hypothetical protein